MEPLVLKLASGALLLTIVGVAAAMGIRKVRTERAYRAQVLKRLHEHAAVSPIPGPRKD